LWSFQPDKGWIGSFEHFAQAFLDGTEPLNADGAAGKLTTDMALALLESLHTGRPVALKE
jgi:predicted dehydrogenase